MRGSVEIHLLTGKYVRALLGVCCSSSQESTDSDDSLETVSVKPTVSSPKPTPSGDGSEDENDLERALAMSMEELSERKEEREQKMQQSPSISVVDGPKAVPEDCLWAESMLAVFRTALARSLSGALRG
eukprot:686408_1